MKEQTHKDKQHLEDQLLKIVHDFLISLQKKRQADAISLNSKLTEDLGIDSLGRVELFHQIEEHFEIYLPESLLTEARTLEDVMRALESAEVSHKLMSEVTFENLGQTRFDPSSSKTLVEVLVKRGQKEPDRDHIYYQDEKGETHPITYGKLLENSMRVASQYHQMGLVQGETVAIMLPTCEHFFYVFMGTLLAGLIPVPIYPPLRPDKIEEYALREAGILKNAGVRVLVTWQAAEKLSSLLKVFIPTLKSVVKSDYLLEGEKKTPATNLNGQSPAFIQYTSGSTSAPKGVLLTHDNLLANIRAVTEVIDIKPGDVGVSWLPLYHDMGLIGCWLTSFYNATPVVIMSPLSFLSRPERWLWALHYHGGTLSAAPNFAYELCVKKIQEKDIEGLDLSRWRLSFNGAEAINPDTLEKFYQKFKPYGLKPTMMYPAYGLAESAVALILSDPEKEPIIDEVDKEIFEKAHRAVPVEAKGSDKKTIRFVCVGKPLPRHDVKIVDDSGEELPFRHVGRLVFKGPSRLREYFNNPEATEKAMVHGWFDSGDYAYETEEGFYITGRKKDIIIKAGRNFYPEEIEEIVSKVENVRKGCVIAFGATDSNWATERLVIVAETKERDKKAQAKLSHEITEQVGAVLGVPPDDVILIAPGKIPKTSSGKLQRSECKKNYDSGQLVARKAPFWMQISRLGLRASWYKVHSLCARVLRFFYSVYVFAFAFINIFAIWSLSWFMPKAWKRPFLKAWARLSMALVGMPVRIQNPKMIPKDPPYVYVANHASYIDAVVLLAILPKNALLIGKKEIMKIPLMRKIFKDIDTLTVDRYDFTRNIEDAQKITEAVEKGRSVALFPEGTFSYAAGLRSFKLGAFKIAAQTKTPVCPIAIKGTRRLFRGNQLLLCPGCIHISVGAPIQPKSDQWEDMAEVHRAAKAYIAQHCGEPVVEA